MQKIKSVLRSIFPFLLFAALVYGVFLLVKYKGTLKYKPIEIDETCIVTEVEFYQIGSISIAQLDPEWRIKTSCGYAYTLRRPVNLGDTIRVKILKYRD
jgi:hypothetical protein